MVDQVIPRLYIKINSMSLAEWTTNIQIYSTVVMIYSYMTLVRIYNIISIYYREVHMAKSQADKD